MDKLTQRQQQVLDIIRQHIDQTGYPPTRADIARELGFKSANAAEEHLKALARKGAIEIIAGASRGIRLPENPGLPIIGRVAAGNPVLAQEHIEDHCTIPADFFRPAADYLLRVTGDSMQDVGILDGDLLAVHRTAEARNGDIVVARIDDEVTVKRFRRGSSRHLIELQAENPDYAPILVDLRTQAFAIEGLSVGILRR
ncbi:transcriptional repressor LexA [Haliea sp.]|jgi:repressor LexA|uniref:transcriptional repressor LexA n=1 Tax=Haliea TaxID=475794 RepID=UPI000C5A80A3|nr:transcriptional repressor LexA [Haliea sp.]MAY94752.1 LexA repressor [Haliea sp.]MBP71756.1 LexA repressor [Haliea sp.]|tara:strand:+ start:4328 stop:4924 length:597 start_codon:yes stop_codon:yes gene_type:complete